MASLHYKKEECIPLETIKRVSRQKKISFSKVYTKVCSHKAVQKDHYAEVLKLLREKKKHMVVQTAPSIRVCIGEEFGLAPGTLVTGKLVSSLRRIGFDRVFDTNFGADVMVFEESTEFLRRIKNKGPFPMITTCCPAWIRFMEHFHPDLIPNMSTCKSPHEMLGMLSKTYYAKKQGIHKKDIVVVSIMPCVAKRFESQRPELKSGVDYVLTTVELARIIKDFGIDFAALPDEKFDFLLGTSTGAAAIFGATGGVMEAAMRTAYELSAGKQIKNLVFKRMRGMRGIKYGEFNLDGKIIKCAAANGLENAKHLLKNIKHLHFVEIMACPGGCIGGGGQPQPWTKEKIFSRAVGLYKEDVNLELRKAHENPAVQQLYKEFIGEPLSKKANKLLHTYFIKRKE
jgi:NADH-quinone oxidoreductase subunit G/NADP-reducing hydrogenase subunit HndD